VHDQFWLGLVNVVTAAVRDYLLAATSTGGVSFVTVLTVTLLAILPQRRTR